MAEPEELILEGAHFATRVARDVWRRYGTSAPDNTVPLASVRVGPIAAPAVIAVVMLSSITFSHLIVIFPLPIPSR